MTIETTLKKRKSQAFGKDIYLLGRDVQGALLWLEAPKWDCEWYWGFGYVESYTNNEYPDRARDISSHQHLDGFLWQKSEGFNDYIHHWNESPRLNATVLTEAESWKLSDLMKQFYTLKEAAEVLGRGGAHLCTPQCTERKDMAERINKEVLPEIFGKVLEILAPKAA